jgi:hypothetical protein
MTWRRSIAAGALLAALALALAVVLATTSAEVETWLSISRA